jgi:hypothetical protein
MKSDTIRYALAEKIEAIMAANGIHVSVQGQKGWFQVIDPDGVRHEVELTVEPLDQPPVAIGRATVRG